MRRLLFLSSISGLLVAGCGDDDCGPSPEATAQGLTLSSADVTLTYGNFTSSANNDCRDPMAPDGVISLTLEGTQTGTSQLITLCIVRPDLLTKMDTQIGDGLRIIDLYGEKDGCTYMYVGSPPATGTVHSSGMCDNGTNDAGYGLAFDGNLLLRRDCSTTVDTIAVEIGGVVIVKQKST